jgi:uncharacterized protein DUF7025
LDSESVSTFGAGETTPTIVEDSGSPMETKPVYIEKVRYTVNFFKTDGYRTNNFSFKKHFNQPFITAVKPQTGSLPVLEDVLELGRNDSQGSQISQYPSYLLDHKQSQKSEVAEFLPGDKILRKYLIIRSAPLLNAIRAVIKYPSEELSTNSDTFEVGKWAFPYKDLYFHLNELKEYKISNPARERHDAENNAECDRHIDHLIQYLYDKNEIQLLEAENRWKAPKPLTIFSSLWLLLKPGSQVFVRENGGLNCFIVDSFSGGTFQEGNAVPYQVEVWNLDFNGKFINRCPKTIEIPVFDGEQEIQSLPVFPVRFYRDDPGQQTLRERLIKRGKSYFILTKEPTLREYSGQGLDHGSRKVCKSLIISLRSWY